MDISVITSTWLRDQLLITRCIPSVWSQKERPLEHIVISDGPDERLENRRPEIEAFGSSLFFLPSHATESHWGAIPRREGVRLAGASAVAFLDDDNAWRPEHLATLAAALADSRADFAFSCAQRWRGQNPIDIIGREPLQNGAIDTSMFLARRELFTLANWEAAGYDSDWDLIRRWLAAGATYTFIPLVTVDYYFR